MRTDTQQRPPSETPILDNCFFYHAMDVPGYGMMPGQWDLCSNVDEYLGHIDLLDKTVLEIGPASGYLTFHMENKGASITACELASFDQWDIVPYAAQDLRHYISDRLELGRRLRNAFWVAHAANQSRAELHLCSIYDICALDKSFDTTVLGSVLLHVRDPFLAVINAAKLTKRTIIVTDMVPAHGLSAAASALTLPQSATQPVPPERHADLQRIVGGELAMLTPSMQFQPRFQFGEPKDTWWQLNPSLIQEFLGIAGFEKQKIYYHYQKYNPKYRWANPATNDEPIYLPLFTVVGER